MLLRQFRVVVSLSCCCVIVVLLYQFRVVVSSGVFRIHKRRGQRESQVLVINHCLS